jgi:hypothetical protein
MSSAVAFRSPRGLLSASASASASAGSTSAELVDVEVLLVSDPVVVAHFTQSCCWHFARVAAELTGLSLWVVGEQHAVVGDGSQFFDVTGWSDRRSLAAAWDVRVRDVQQVDSVFFDEWAETSELIGSVLLDDGLVGRFVTDALTLFAADASPAAVLV